MEKLYVAIAIYALIVLGFLIAMLVIEINILHESTRAANASVDLDNVILEIKQDIKNLYDWIISH